MPLNTKLALTVTAALLCALPGVEVNAQYDPVLMNFRVGQCISNTCPYYLYPSGYFPDPFCVNVCARHVLHPGYGSVFSSTEDGSGSRSIMSTYSRPIELNF